MPYKDKGKQRDANRKVQEKRRGVTKEGVTNVEPRAEAGVTRLNPINGKPYGPAMLGVTAEQLTEYERKVNAPRVLVISELSTPHRDYLYRCLVNNKRGE